MQARKLALSRGLAWMVEGFWLVRRKPVPILSAASTLAMVIMLMVTTPVLGPIVVAMLLPVLEIGMFLICRAAGEGEFVHPTLLFAGFRMNLRPLFAVGGLRLVCNMVVLLIAITISGLDVEGLLALVAAKKTVPDTFQRATFTMLGWFFLLRIPFEMAGWFAAPCIALRGASVLKALFFSLVACWRNFGTMAVFALAVWLVCGLLPSFLLSLMIALPLMLSLPLFAFSVVLSVAVFYAAFYRSACDVFGEWPHPWTHER